MIRFLCRHVQIKVTPNPLCKKFIPDKRVMNEGTCDFPSSVYANISPLAQDLFNIKGISRIFYSPEYVAVTKTEFSDWEQLTPFISQTIDKYFNENIPIFTIQRDEKNNYNLDDEVESVINEILEGRIRPYLQEDGGDMRFIEFNKETGIVLLELQGSCAGCPSAFTTLKDGIEKMLMFYIPEVKGVLERHIDNKKDKVLV